MEILFGAENWFLYLLVCIVVALGITFIIYFRNKETNELGKWQLRVLYSLRFLSFFLLSVLLLSPLVKTLKRYVNKPVIITAFDNSSSLLTTGDSAEVKLEINKIYTELKNQLEKEYKLVNYTFGEKPVTNRALDFSEKRTDYSKLINSVYNNHFNENVGALIVVGDGIYNMGLNPVSVVQKLNFPVYSVGIGDTSIVKDAGVSEVKVNRNAFAGNQFPVELGLHFEKMVNEPSVVEIIHKQKVVFSQRILPNSDDYFTTTNCMLAAGEPGLQHYSVRLNNLQRERNKQNNNSGFVINIIENKQKILILSEGPHPDLGAIKNALELQQNFEVSIFAQEPYPSNFNDFNLIILNQIPSVGKSGAALINKTLKSKTPLLFLVGNKTYLPQLNQLNQGIEIIQQAGSNEEAQSVYNNGFEIFKISEELIEMLEKFPPLKVPFADYNLDVSFSTLLHQKINNIKTSRPLIVTGNREGRKIGFIFGEGIWRWRLYNYYFNESHDQFNEFISSIIQYLALRENDDNFIVDYQSVFNETDPVIIKAQVYNEAFEAINEPEASIKISNDDGIEYNFIFDRNENFYRVNAGKLPIGNYRFVANVTIGEEEFTKQGNFAVIPVNIESIVTKANFNMLFQLANQTGGNFYYKNETSKLIDQINNNQNIKPVSYFQTSLNEMLNLKGIFLVLLLLFGMEWFLRKYWGIY